MDALLHEAVSSRNVEGVRRALDGGADPNAPGYMGDPPLVPAVWWSRGLGFVPRRKDQRGPTVHYTPEQLQANANARWRAAVQLVTLLLDRGARVDLADNSGLTPLLAACINGPPTTEIIELLLARGADPRVRMPNGDTALHTAASDDVPHLIRLLLAQGLDVNARQERGNTALMSAASAGALGSIRALLDGGANPTVTNNEGRTARDIARAGREHAAARILRPAELAWKRTRGQPTAP